MNKNAGRGEFYKRIREKNEQNQDKKNPIVKPQYRMYENNNKGQSKEEGR